MTFARRSPAVLVLAAGAGTRMRSDTPKVLHTLAGPAACWRTRCTRSPRSPRSISCVVLGHDRDRIAPAVDRARRRRWAARSTSPCRTSSSAPGTPSHAAWPALPDDFAGIVVVTSGDVPLLDADTLADLIDAHGAEAAAATVLTTTLPDPTGYGRILRTQDGEVIGIVEQADATPSQRAIREVNAGVYAFDIAALRSALSRLRRDNAQQELYLTDVISIVRRDGRVVRAKHVDDTALVAGVNDRVQLAELAAELNRRIVAAPSARRRDDHRPGHHLDRRRRDHRPRHRRSSPAPSCSAPPASAAAADRPGHHADRRHRRRRRLGGPHPRRSVDDRRRRSRRPVHLPAARHRAGRRRQARRVRRDQERRHRHRHQGAAPDLRRRRRHRRAQQHRRVERVRQLRRRRPSGAPRSARTCAPAPTPCSSRRSPSATAPTPARAPSCATTCRRARWPCRRVRSATSRAGWSASDRAAPPRRRPERPRPAQARTPRTTRRRRRSAAVRILVTRPRASSDATYD